MIAAALLTATTFTDKENQDTGQKKSSPHPLIDIRKAELYTLWDENEVLPKSANIPVLDNVEFQVIKKWQPEIDGYHWLHGVAIAWHKDKLFASFGHNKGRENSPGEEVHGRFSIDGGKSWSELFTIATPDEDNLGISHGVFLSRGDKLWAFHGAFYDIRKKTHTRAYVLGERTGQWLNKGVVIEGGFWPFQEPLKMNDGNWIMSGIRVDDDVHGDSHPAVAISHGDDLTKWDLVLIPNDGELGSIWGESTVFIDGSRVVNVSRWNTGRLALASISEDFGRTWAPSHPTNLPMANSKPYTGTLSTGQHYLVCTTTAEGDERKDPTGMAARHPLTIAVTRPGEMIFSKVFVIRHAIFPEGPGESHPDARQAYPYAVENNGKLYVGYSNGGGRRGNRNSAELAIIPVENLNHD